MRKGKKKKGSTGKSTIRKKLKTVRIEKARPIVAIKREKKGEGPQVEKLTTTRDYRKSPGWEKISSGCREVKERTSNAMSRRFDDRTQSESDNEEKMVRSTGTGPNAAVIHKKRCWKESTN